MPPLSASHCHSPSFRAAWYFKRSLTSCDTAKFSTPYSSVAAGEQACTASSTCYGVYDASCDGTGSFYLCKSEDQWVSGGTAGGQRRTTSLFGVSGLCELSTATISGVQRSCVQSPNYAYDNYGNSRQCTISISTAGKSVANTSSQALTII